MTCAEFKNKWSRHQAKETTDHHGSRQWCFKLLAPATAILLALVVGELIARWAGVNRYHPYGLSRHSWSTSDPILGWKNNPGIHASEEWFYAFQTVWPDGRRATRPVAGPAPSKTREVILLGCSFMAGYGVSDSETVGWLLDASFNDLEFSNYATTAYGTYQSLLLLEDLLDNGQKHPYLVIYGFCGFMKSAMLLPMDGSNPYALLVENAFRHLPS